MQFLSSRALIPLWRDRWPQGTSKLDWPSRWTNSPFPLSGRRRDDTSSAARRTGPQVEDSSRSLDLGASPRSRTHALGGCEGLCAACNRGLGTLLDRTSCSCFFSRSGSEPRHDSRALRERRPFEQRTVHLTCGPPENRCRTARQSSASTWGSILIASSMVLIVWPVHPDQ
jgi:hypothetical protein